MNYAIVGKVSRYKMYYTTQGGGSCDFFLTREDAEKELNRINEVSRCHLEIVELNPDHTVKESK